MSDIIRIMSDIFFCPLKTILKIVPECGRNTDNPPAYVGEQWPAGVKPFACMAEKVRTSAALASVVLKCGGDLPGNVQGCPAVLRFCRLGVQRKVRALHNGARALLC